MATQTDPRKQTAPCCPPLAPDEVCDELDFFYRLTYSTAVGKQTPAGIPAIECTLEHRSQQHEAGGLRKVECEMHAVAFGEVALALDRCTTGSALRVDGFIARRYRTGTSVALHVTELNTVTFKDQRANTRVERALYRDAGSQR